MYQTSARTQGAIKLYPHSFAPKNKAILLKNPSTLEGHDLLRYQLAKLHQKSFISTDTDIANFKMDFLKEAEQLQSMGMSIHKIIQEYRLPEEFDGTTQESSSLSSSSLNYLQFILSETFTYWISSQNVTDRSNPNADRMESSEEILIKLFNITYLPTYAEVIQIFPMFSPTYQLEHVSTSILLTPLSEILESRTPPTRKNTGIAGEDFLSPDAWAFFWSNKWYYRCEILTQEFIHEFASYLMDRMTHINQQLFIQGNQKQVVKILDIGAGTGQLLYFLKRDIKERFENINFEFDMISIDKSNIIYFLTSPCFLLSQISIPYHTVSHDLQ